MLIILLYFTSGKRWFMILILHGATDLLDAVEHIRSVISARKEKYIFLPLGMYDF